MAAGDKILKVVIAGDAAGAKGAAKETEGAFLSVQNHARGLSTALKGIAGPALGLLAGIEVKNFLKDSIQGWQEHMQVMAITNQVIKTTGGAAKVSAGQVDELATSLERKTGVDAETIINGQNLLLTFTNITNQVGKGNDIFTQATKITNDMSVALGQDMKSSAIQVGKALNDPIKGMTALQRVGVSFTAQQTAQVAAMVKAGNTLGAQKLILNELGKEFGGAAEAAVTPQQKLRVAMKEVKDEIGQRLLPIVQKITLWFANALPKALDFVTGVMHRLGPVLKEVRGYALAFISAFRFPDDGITSAGFAGKMERFGILCAHVFQDVKHFIVDVLIPAFERFASRIPGIIETVRAFITDKLIPAFQAIWNNIQPLMVKLEAMFMAAWGAIVAIVRAALFIVGAVIFAGVVIVEGLWQRFGQHLVDHLRIAWNAIKQILSGAITMLTGIFNFIHDLLTGKWGKLWGDLKQIVSGAWNVILGSVKYAINAVSNAIGLGMAAVSLIWHGTWKAIQATMGGILGWFGKLPGRMGGLFVGMFDGVKEAFKSAINFVIGGWNSLHFGVPSFSAFGHKVGGFDIGVPQIPMLANGGNIAGAGAVIVGDAGPEVLNLPKGARVTPLSHAGNAAPQVNVAVTVEGHVRSDTDLANAIAEPIRNALRQFAQNNGGKLGVAGI